MRPTGTSWGAEDEHQPESEKATVMPICEAQLIANRRAASTAVGKAPQRPRSSLAVLRLSTGRAPAAAVAFRLGERPRSRRPRA